MNLFNKKEIRRINRELERIKTRLSRLECPHTDVKPVAYELYEDSGIFYFNRCQSCGEEWLISRKKYLRDSKKYHQKEAREFSDILRKGE
jgi:formylmethanofuran dehydrogenase subunit E